MSPTRLAPRPVLAVASAAAVVTIMRANALFPTGTTTALMKGSAALVSVFVALLNKLSEPYCK